MLRASNWRPGNLQRPQDADATVEPGGRSKATTPGTSTISSSGVLSIPVHAELSRAAADSNSDNVYNVTVKASAGGEYLRDAGV